jgi:hypothetical protein
MRLPATPQRMPATTAQPSHTTAYHSNIHARSLLRPPPLAATTACSRVGSAGASLLICPLCPLVKGLSVVFDQLHCWSGLTKTAQRPGPDGGLGLEAVRSPQHPKTGPDHLVWSSVFEKPSKTGLDRTTGSLVTATATTAVTTTRPIF